MFTYLEQSNFSGTWVCDKLGMYFDKPKKEERFMDIVIGYGEIGKPLAELLAGVYTTHVIDPKYFSSVKGIKGDFLHICIPGAENFKEIVLGYIGQYEPEYTIIHSTVKPGTTREIEEEQHVSKLVYSPVHGRHANGQMKHHLLHFPKYIGGTDKDAVNAVRIHLMHVGFDVHVMDSPEEAEWSKIVSTTYSALLISWAQELERLCDKYGLDYDNLTHIFPYGKSYVPPHYPGVIGGHCLMQNLELWEGDSMFVDVIKKSNEMKKGRK